MATVIRVMWLTGLCICLVWSNASLAAGMSMSDCLELASVKYWEGTFTITGSNIGSATGSNWNYQGSWSANLKINNPYYSSDAQIRQAQCAATINYDWPFLGDIVSSTGSFTGTESNSGACSTTDTFNSSSTQLNLLSSQFVLNLSLPTGTYNIGLDAPGEVLQQSLPVNHQENSCGKIYNYTGDAPIAPNPHQSITGNLPGATSSSLDLKFERTYQQLGPWGVYTAASSNLVTWTETWNLKAFKSDPVPLVEDPCLQSGSIIGCENRSLGEAVAVGGTPFRLHYQSNRVASASGVNAVATAYALDLGGWTLNVHHRYDPASNTLFLGTGGFRSAASLGTVTASASSGFLIASEDGQRVYEFDSNGVHLSTRNALTGATLLSFAYDASGRLASVTDGSSNATTFTRNAQGKLVSITGPYGQVSKVTLSQQGYITSLKDPAGKSVRAKYTKTGLMTAFTNARGNTSSFTYDASGLLVQDKNAVGGKQTLATNAAGDTVTHTSAMGHTTTYQTVTQADGSIDRTVTEPSGLVNTSHKDALLAETVAGSDGMQTSSTPAADPRFGNSASVVQAYTATTPSALTNTMGATRTATLASADPFSLTTQTETLTRNGNTYTSLYDAASNTTTGQSAMGRLSARTIDSLGRTVSEQIDGLNPVTYTYDSHGRLASASTGSGADARTTSYSYDANGYLQSTTDPLGQVVSYTNDKLGRPLQTTLPGGNLLKFGYDADGNLTKLTNPAGKSYAFTYGKTGQLSKFTLPAAKSAKTKQTYTYNQEDQITGMVRLDGTKLAYGYDSAGRLSTLTADTGAQAQTWAYGYDATHGQFSTVTSPDGITLGFTHDGELLQEMSWSGPVASSVGFTYSTDFQLASVSVNNADTIPYTYDADGLLTVAGTLTLQRSAQHGLITGAVLGNITDAVTYNAFAETTTYTAESATEPLIELDYAYDKLGRITQRTELLGGTEKTYSYSYDTAGRLTGVSEGTATTTYGYDKNGNRISASTTGGASVTGTYDAQDRLLSYGDVSYTYGKNGEVTSRIAGSVTTQLEYNDLGNLVVAGLSDGTRIDYLVDGSGMRVGRKVNGALQQAFLYQSSLRPVAELDGSGNVVSRFVYATHVNVPDYMVKGGITYRIVTDHLGSPRLVVNATDGSVAQRIDYDEFGNVLQDTNPGFQPFGFAGGLYDPDTHLLHFGAREYDPKTGKWLSPDPIGFNSGSINLYAYVNNDPVNYVDNNGQGGVKVGGALYNKVKEAKFLKDASVTSEQITYLRPGDQVIWLGHAPGTLFDKIGIVRAKNKACVFMVGYTLRQNLTPQFEKPEFLNDDGRPIANNAWWTDSGSAKM
jgi:RHS repeat-associated protein